MISLMERMDTMLNLLTSLKYNKDPSPKIAAWNDNGLAQQSQKNTIIIENEIDVVLISESHFTDQTYFKIPRCTTYNTKHPDNTAHAGTAIIIRNTI